MVHRRPGPERRDRDGASPARPRGWDYLAGSRPGPRSAFARAPIRGTPLARDVPPRALRSVLPGTPRGRVRLLARAHEMAERKLGRTLVYNELPNNETFVGEGKTGQSLEGIGEDIERLYRQRFGRFINLFDYE